MTDNPSPAGAEPIPAVPQSRRAHIRDLARRRCEQYRVDGWEQLGDAVINFAEEIIRADLAAPVSAPPAPQDEQESLRVQHARKQGAADGFQEGWHAALTRIREGDKTHDLRELIPTHRSEVEARYTALCDQIDQLIEQWRRHSVSILNGLKAAADPREVQLEFEAASRMYRGCADELQAIRSQTERQP